MFYFFKYGAEIGAGCSAESSTKCFVESCFVSLKDECSFNWNWGFILILIKSYHFGLLQFVEIPSFKSNLVMCRAMAIIVLYTYHSKIAMGNKITSYVTRKNSQNRYNFGYLVKNSVLKFGN